MVNFNGFHENLLTLKVSGKVKPGETVAIGANKTVSPCPDSVAFSGVARSVREGYASVQFTGYVCLPYTGTAPSLGVTSLVSNGSGGVKSGTGRQVIVLEVDTTARTCGFIM
ncbi:MAG TPA: hypothetical protein GXX17_01345 [Clostridiales bacterium]|nr:hypothetical protein [Clostridiales bacterium]